MSHKTRRILGVLILCAGLTLAALQYAKAPDPRTDIPVPQGKSQLESPLAMAALENLLVKGKSPKTGYNRAQFGDGWSEQNGCDTRNVILYRDLSGATRIDGCKVSTGTLADPYTGKTIQFVRGEATSTLVQIDHVVALSNSWQTGAQQLTKSQRILLANDPLELLAVDGPANEQKGDADAASWLPSNKPFRCQYVARQIAVKAKYQLWVTPSEKNAMKQVLSSCPAQKLPTAK